jgi:hypothetical protein
LPTFFIASARKRPISECLPGMVAHDEASVLFLDGPRRRESGGRDQSDGQRVV